MSIVRIGLAETENFGTGYDVIFGKKKAAPPARKPAKAAGKRKPAKSKAKKAKKK